MAASPRRSTSSMTASTRSASDGDLLLLEHHRGDAWSLHGLQEEGAIARLADGAGGEAIGRVEVP